MTVSAAKSGRFRIGADMEVVRLGFGSMRLTGRGIWGPPSDHGEAIRTLQRVPELGMNFIDTADSYGPNVAEELIREALHPYKGVCVATKAGLARTGPDQWTPLCRAEYLIQQAYTSCARLGVERLDLWQLHRIDPKVPRDEQFGAIKELLDRGVIRHAGLSEVSVADIKAASLVFLVVSVLFWFFLVDRGSEVVLAYCTGRQVGVVPWLQLAAGDLAAPGSVLDTMARKYQAVPSQVALAWMLKRSPVMLPIPGTSKAAHLEENVAGVDIQLSDEDFATLDTAGKRGR